MAIFNSYVKLPEGKTWCSFPTFRHEDHALELRRSSALQEELCSAQLDVSALREQLESCSEELQLCQEDTMVWGFRWATCDMRIYMSCITLINHYIYTIYTYIYI